jgi:uncharacterized protein YbjT (DUF2867 family)
MDILVVGARGGLGQLICGELTAKGHTTKTVDRAAARDPDALAAAAAGTGALIDCAGASVAMGLGKGWRGYGAVDVPIGLACVEAARRAKVRMVYVGVHHDPRQASTAYVAAHERVAAAMQDIDGVVVRATGFFSAYAALLPMARRGTLFDVGSGEVRTNPIDERDLAGVVADAAFGDGPRDVGAGGPDVLTRRQIFEMVGAATGRKVKVRGVPIWLAAIGSACFRVVHPRMGQFARFAVALARYDAIAPSLGARRFADYLTGSVGGKPAVSTTLRSHSQT